MINFVDTLNDFVIHGKIDKADAFELLQLHNAETSKSDTVLALEELKLQTKLQEAARNDMLNAIEASPTPKRNKQVDVPTEAWQKSIERELSKFDKLDRLLDFFEFDGDTIVFKGDVVANG